MKEKSMQDYIVVVAILLASVFIFFSRSRLVVEDKDVITDAVALPAPSPGGTVSVEEGLLFRRSVRDFRKGEITKKHLSQLLWAAQGITKLTDQVAYRTAPSAGATYPISLYVAVSAVKGVVPGIYRYRCGDHVLEPVSSGDKRAEIASAAIGQSFLMDAAINIVLFGDLSGESRVVKKYGERAARYVFMEAGHIAQNVYLQVVALRLGTVVMGAFDDAAMRKLFGAGDDEIPLYVMPVGLRLS